MFQSLEVNKRMDEVRQAGESGLFRYIRGRYERRMLSDAAEFGRVLDDLRHRCAEINVGRVGRGPYLHVDGALPTDLSDGWVVVSFLNVRKAQARITLSLVRGEVGEE